LPSTDSSNHKSQKASTTTSSGILELSKSKAELLASNLQQWNLLRHSLKVTIFHIRNQEFEQFFKTVGYFIYCQDIDGLMHMRHSPDQWRIFIDASKTNLEAVLLHNRNNLHSITGAYAPSTKEAYTTMNNILVEVDYKKYQREICGDFKVIAVLLGLQAGYTKYSFFLCEWDTRTSGFHYSKEH